MSRTQICKHLHKVPLSSKSDSALLSSSQYFIITTITTIKSLPLPKVAIVAIHQGFYSCSHVSHISMAYSVSVISFIFLFLFSFCMHLTFPLNISYTNFNGKMLLMQKEKGRYSHFCLCGSGSDI